MAADESGWHAARACLCSQACTCPSSISSNYKKDCNCSSTSAFIRAPWSGLHLARALTTEHLMLSTQCIAYRNGELQCFNRSSTLLASPMVPPVSISGSWLCPADCDRDPPHPAGVEAAGHHPCHRHHRLPPGHLQLCLGQVYSEMGHITLLTCTSHSYRFAPAASSGGSTINPVGPLPYYTSSVPLWQQITRCQPGSQAVPLLSHSLAIQTSLILPLPITALHPQIL